MDTRYVETSSRIAKYAYAATTLLASILLILIIAAAVFCGCRKAPETQAGEKKAENENLINGKEQEDRLTRLHETRDARKKKNPVVETV